MLWRRRLRGIVVYFGVWLVGCYFLLYVLYMVYGSFNYLSKFSTTLLYLMQAAIHSSGLDLALASSRLRLRQGPGYNAVWVRNVKMERLLFVSRSSRRLPEL